ncbi:calmodulin-like protein CamC, partial [Volvox carteri f. nagariensis]
LKEVFQLFDTEDKGYFTKDDLFFVMEAMGGSPTPQELDAVMYELDSNGDSVVDFPEFLTKFLTATDEKELLSVFHQLAIQEGEGNDDRFAKPRLFAHTLTQYVGERLTDEDKKYLEIIFRGADKDNNGRLDIKEFTAYL